MIQSIKFHNTFACIDKGVEIYFGNYLNVLVGNVDTGKSLLLSMLLNKPKDIVLVQQSIGNRTVKVPLHELGSKVYLSNCSYLIDEPEQYFADIQDFLNILKENCKSQFIIATHHKRLMNFCRSVYSMNVNAWIDPWDYRGLELKNRVDLSADR